MIPRLVVITDWALGESELLRKLEAALATAGSAMAVQHRNPEATTGVYFEQGRRLKALCDRYRAELFVSARLDVALALRVHLHLPVRALRPVAVRAALPQGRWISVAVHTEDEASTVEGADLALVSPVFATASKPGVRPLESEGFGRLAAKLRCPAYALGGVTAERVRKLPGVAGAAAIGAVLGSEDPGRAAMELLSALG